MAWKDQAEIYRADDQQVMDANVPKLFFDEPQTTPEGGQIWLRSSKVPLHNDMNETIGILGVYEDITAYKQAAQALEEAEHRSGQFSMPPWTVHTGRYTNPYLAPW